jgi:methyltransferase (TIGR00027 family)
VTAGSVDHVTDTAFFVAQYRADESARPDALFQDPLAARLAGTRGKTLADARIAREVTAWLIAVRTVIIDDFLRDALANGVDTVVNLGAGLDARPYRLELPSNLLWIEADFPEMISYKESVLADETPRCRLERFSVDLSNGPERRAFLNDVESRSGKLLVLTEGVIPYLTNEQVAELAKDLLSLSAPMSWIADYMSKDAQDYRRRSGAEEQMRKAPFLFKPGNWFGFFGALGWRVKTIKYLPIEGRRLGRPFPMPGRTRSWRTFFKMLFYRNARRRFAVSMGYAVLEPVQNAVP